MYNTEEVAETVDCAAASGLYLGYSTVNAWADPLCLCDCYSVVPEVTADKSHVTPIR